MKRLGGRFVIVLASLMAFLPSMASACSVCMGDPNSKQAGAINAAIFLMLGFIGSVLALVAGSGIYLVKRANTDNEEKNLQC